MLPTLSAVNVRNLTSHETYELFRFHGDQRSKLCEKYNITFKNETQKQKMLLFHLSRGVEKHAVLTGFYLGFEYEAAINDETIIGYTQDLIKILWNKLKVREFEEIKTRQTAVAYVQTVNLYLIKCGKRL